MIIQILGSCSWTNMFLHHSVASDFLSDFLSVNVCLKSLFPFKNTHCNLAARCHFQFIKQDKTEHLLDNKQNLLDWVILWNLKDNNYHHKYHRPDNTVTACLKRRLPTHNYPADTHLYPCDRQKSFSCPVLTRASATAASTSVPVLRIRMALTEAEIRAWWDSRSAGEKNKKQLKHKPAGRLDESVAMMKMFKRSLNKSK